jgi:DNA-binding NarL/FixJ family response regulator
MKRIKVLIADDHTMFREGLRQILERQSDMIVVGEAKDGFEAVEKVKSLAPDIVLMDIGMPLLDGVSATRLITEKNPDVGIIILTMYRRDEYVFEAIKAGARGYLLKDSRSKRLIETIREVYRGEASLDPKMAARVLEEFRRLAEEAKPKAFAELTERQVEILRLVAQGASNKEIAQKLFLSEKTVKNNLTIIFQKLYVNSRTQAAIYALREGLVSL